MSGYPRRPAPCTQGLSVPNRLKSETHPCRLRFPNTSDHREWGPESLTTGDSETYTGTGHSVGGFDLFHPRRSRKDLAGGGPVLLDGVRAEVVVRRVGRPLARD